MPMRVYHARHQGPAAAVDDLRSIRRGKLVRGKRLDPSSLDQKAKPALQRRGFAVEQEEIREQDGSEGVRRLRRGAAREAERGERRAHACNEASSREVADDAPSNRADFGPAAPAAAVRNRVGRVVRGGAGEHASEPMRIETCARNGPLYTGRTGRARNR